MLKYRFNKILRKSRIHPGALKILNQFALCIADQHYKLQHGRLKLQLQLYILNCSSVICLQLQIQDETASETTVAATCRTEHNLKSDLTVWDKCLIQIAFSLDLNCCYSTNVFIHQSVKALDIISPLVKLVVSKIEALPTAL